MGMRRRALGWATIVGIVAVTAGVCWVLAQGERETAAGFAAEYPFHSGEDVQPDARQVRVIATDKLGGPLIGAELTARNMLLEQQPATSRHHFPIAGTDGDWVVYNITSRGLSLGVSCLGYARGSDSDHARISDLASAPDTCRFTLYRGANATGRVVDLDTGEPIEGARVVLPGGNAVTDADGRYAANHISPTTEPAARIRARARDYVPAHSGEIRFEDETACVIPDIRLQRGGFIVGDTLRPEKADEDIYFRASAGLERLDKENRSHSTDVKPVAPDGTFRLGPIRPSTHVLRIRAGNSPGKKSVAQLIQNPRNWNRAWEARKPGVEVKSGEETDVGTIELELISEERATDGWAY